MSFYAFLIRTSCKSILISITTKSLFDRYSMNQAAMSLLMYIAALARLFAANCCTELG